MPLCLQSEITRKCYFLQVIKILLTPIYKKYKRFYIIIKYKNTDKNDVLIDINRWLCWRYDNE